MDSGGSLLFLYYYYSVLNFFSSFGGYISKACLTGQFELLQGRLNGDTVILEHPLSFQKTLNPIGSI